MRIVFLCGSLEPGRDGVGDYVRQLARALRGQQHTVGAVALNDTHITDAITSPPTQPEADLAVLRLPAAWKASARFQRAEAWVEAFRPEWVSVQFVPFAFHARGLPLRLSKHLRALAKHRPVHLMMHECWVGAGPADGLKRHLMSRMQKALIRSFIANLQPAVIHTHLPVYQAQLQQLGWLARPLPLFSNIPVVPQVGPVPAPPAAFRVGIFSQADASASLCCFLRSLAKQLAPRPCQVLLMGGDPVRMLALATALEAGEELRGRVRHTGFLEPEALSLALQSCQLGLTSVPRSALGKSGSVAAFLAHGIPVAAPCVLPEAQPSDIGFFSASLRSCILGQPNMSSVQAARIAVQAARSTLQLPAIADAFMHDLLSPYL